jgi:large subunit ribosomal protein L28
LTINYNLEFAPIVIGRSCTSFPEAIMAKRCEICGKGPVVGRTISHAHNVGPRRFEPNLQSVKAIINGATRRIRVCTRCLRSGKVTKAA